MFYTFAYCRLGGCRPLQAFLLQLSSSIIEYIASRRNSRLYHGPNPNNDKDRMPDRRFLMELEGYPAKPRTRPAAGGHAPRFVNAPKRIFLGNRPRIVAQ